VTPKAYTPKSLSGPLPPDSDPTQKTVDAIGFDVLMMIMMMCCN